MDLISLISNTRRYTLHSHTQFCDGHASMEEMAESAVKSGMLVYGFSPHSPLCIPSPCNMSADDVPTYFEEVRRIAARFPQTRFLAGMEIDYLNDDWGPATPYFQGLGLDYSIGSIHFILSQNGEYVDIDGKFENFKRRMSDHFCNDIEYVVDAYYAQSRHMLAAGGFDILGHFDKVGQNASYYAPGIEDSSFYKSLIENYISQIINSGVIVEINTKARTAHGRFFPDFKWLPALIDGDVKIVVNSDAHSPELVNASRDEAFALLDKITIR